MTDVVVRATEAGDLPRISDLTEKVFGLRRDVGVLRWLLANPHDPERIDSWVAERRGDIVGHTGILKSRYRSGGRWVTGAHAFLWMVDPECRGDAGMALGRAIVRCGDFLIVLGGTATTKAILAGRRFVETAAAKEYRFELPDGSPASSVAAGLELVERNGRPDAMAALPAAVTGNEAAPEHLEWLAGCPELDAALFTLERGGRPLGPVLLYVNRRRSPATGRAVHLPFLGDEPAAWGAALAAIGDELRRRGCRSWTVLATHPALVEACETAGAELAASRPVWIRERGRALAPGSWHLTYLEGDLAYRRV